MSNPLEDSRWAYIVFFGLLLVFSIYIFVHYEITKSERDVVYYSLVGLSVGALFFISGFKELKVPCPQDQLLTAPLSGEPCAYYSLTAFIKDGDGWDEIGRIYSHKEIYVEGKEGALALVKIREAEVMNKRNQKTYVLNSNNISQIPEPLRSVLKNNAGKLKGFSLAQPKKMFGTDTYMFKETYFAPKEPIYVLGYASSGSDLNKAYLPELKSEKPNRKISYHWFQMAMKLIRTKPEMKKRFDTNQDGYLDPDEMQRGAQELGQELKDGQVERLQADTGHAVKMVFKKKEPHIFLVSNQSEHHLTRKMGGSGKGSIYGGAALSILSIGFLFSVVSALPPKAVKDKLYEAHELYQRGNSEAASQKYRTFAEQGDARAQYHLGYLYYSGIGVPQNDRKAGEWFLKAARQGNASAQYHLGIMHSWGRGVTEDHVRAYKWFSLAIAGATDAKTRALAKRDRGKVEKKMSPQKVAEAQHLARIWKPITKN